MSQFLHANKNDDTKAIAIPWVFSENSRAKNLVTIYSKALFFRVVSTLDCVVES